MKKKDKYGDVSTPKYFVENILDLLPDSVWYDPTLKWLDPGCGNGIFIECVYYRLLKTLSSFFHDENILKKHIIHNMLFMIEINNEYSSILNEKFGNNANIIIQDFLLWEPYFKFDIIIGNPPYNINGNIKVPTNKINEKKSDGKTIWKIFIKKYFYLLNENGYLSLCVPAIWMKPDKENMYTLFLKKNILKIQCFDNTETNKIFSYNAQTPISCISLSNNKNNNDYQNILLFDKFIKNNFISYKINYLSPIPMQYGYIFDIFQPYIKMYGSLSSIVNKTNMPPKKAELSDNKNNYINIHSCLLNEKINPKLLIKYSNIPLMYHGVKKIVCAHKMYGFPYYDYNGSFGISNRDNYVIVEDKIQNSELLFYFLSTSFCRTLFKATRYRMKYLEKYIFELIPNILHIPDFPREINNTSLCDFFNLQINSELIKDNYNSFSFIKN